MNENCEPEAILMPWPLCLYLSGSAFLVSFTDPNKQLIDVKFMLKFLNHGFSV